MFQRFGDKLALPKRICSTHRKETRYIYYENGQIRAFVCHLCVQDTEKAGRTLPYGHEFVSFDNFHQILWTNIAEYEKKLRSKKKINTSELRYRVNAQKELVQNRFAQIIESLTQRLLQDKIEIFRDLDNLQQIILQSDNELVESLSKGYRTHAYLKAAIEDKGVFQLKLIMERKNAIDSFMRNVEEVRILADKCEALSDSQISTILSDEVNKLENQLFSMKIEKILKDQSGSKFTHLYLVPNSPRQNKPNRSTSLSSLSGRRANTSHSHIRSTMCSPPRILHENLNKTQSPPAPNKAIPKIPRPRVLYS